MFLLVSYFTQVTLSVSACRQHRQKHAVPLFFETAKKKASDHQTYVASCAWLGESTNSSL